MLRFRATSYAMGAVIGQAVFSASSYDAARRHPKVKALPAGGQGDRGKIRVIGLRVLG